MIAILGAAGQLGSAFARRLEDRAIAVTRRDLDLQHIEDIRPWVASARPDLILNCAAYTDVDGAETSHEPARAVNATAVGVLAEAASEHGARIVTFSTDYVFDGEKPTGYVESDEPNPLSVYGRTKLEGEKIAIAANPDTLVVRTSWLLSHTHPNFMSTILEKLEEGEVSVVDDQRGRPTFADDLARATLDAVDCGATGILHLSNRGETTWFQLACNIADLAGFDRSRVKPMASAELNRPARRPANSVLDSERLADLGVEPLPGHRQSLEAAIGRMVG